MSLHADHVTAAEDRLSVGQKFSCINVHREAAELSILDIGMGRSSSEIVMRVSGRGKTLNDALMADTIRQVLHQATVPVVVPPAEKRREIKKTATARP